MVLEGLASSLKDTLRKIVNAPHIDAALIKEVVKEIQRALLLADINAALALRLTKEIERRALTEKPPAGMSSRDHVVRIVYEELVRILGETREISLKKHVIMMVGLYGQGKTTTAGKLALYFKKRGLRVGLVAGDVHRPAAYDQLTQLGARIGVPVHGEPGETRAPKMVREGMEKFDGYDIIIIDTSGRHSLEDDLVEEMKRIANVAQPDEKFLVIDAVMGQTAGPQARAFHEAITLTGVIITKMDGTAKAGGALSAVQATKAPVVFIGTGEHIDELEKFNPPGFISRLLGMGDIKALMEQAQGVVDEASAEETARKIMSGRFTLKDMYEQMRMVSDMGPLGKLMSYLPGVGGKMSKEQMEAAQARIKQFKVIMNSMTKEEMENPRIIKAARIRRIARGAGVEAGDVRALLKQYDNSRRMVKNITSDRKQRRALMKMLGEQGME
ncbi:MAG: signal recognition particle protein [Euryarchaeota archaeon]|nr:signal recognition particle protein [Euryarchaeota archaeon]